MNFNLPLAVFWLVLGIVFLGYDWLNPGARWGRVSLWGSDISVGWFALLLAVYNLVRWSVSRPARTRQQAADDCGQRLRERHDEERPIEPPDPRLRFTEQPPEAERK